MMEENDFKSRVLGDLQEIKERLDRKDRRDMEHEKRLVTLEVQHINMIDRMKATRSFMIRVAGSVIAAVIIATLVAVYGKLG